MPFSHDTNRIWRATFIALALAFLPFRVFAMPAPPDVAKTIVFIFLADDQGNVRLAKDGITPLVNGTGFFVSVPNENGPGLYGYLVTAKHVLQDEAGNYYKQIIVRINDKKKGAPLLRLDLHPDGKDKNVFAHADSNVDIAVIPALPDVNVYDFLALPLSLIKSKEDFQKTKIGPGSDVFFAGLFVPHYGVKSNVPIFRFGRVAMLPDECVQWNEKSKPPQCVELYLLETMSFGGASGSPVFFSLGIDRELGQIYAGWEISLAGVMRGNFNEPRAGDFIETPNRVAPLFAQNVGIAAVTPAHLLREILLSDELVKQRRDHPIVPPDTTGSTPQPDASKPQ